MEEFEYDGIWWLPERPEERISGVLKFHPAEGANLELTGSFEDFRNSMVISLENPHSEVDIILGVASDGKIVTLYRCYGRRFHTSMPGVSSLSFTVGFVFVGHHFEKEEDIVFISLSINYSHLEDWTGITGFQHKEETDSEAHLTRVKNSYSFPQKVEAEVNNLNIAFDYVLDSYYDFTSVRLKQITSIKVSPREQTHFNDYLKDIYYHIQNFLSLAVGRPVYPLIIKGKTQACATELPDGGIAYNDILISYQVRGLSDLSKTVLPSDMLFSFKDVSGDFENCLRNWFRKSEVLGPVYDLYFGTLYNPSMYLQHQFLSLTRAMESYHRRTCHGKYLPDEYYERIRETLVEAIPQDVDKEFRESLKQRLEYHNEFSLRRRLKEVLRKCGNVSDLLIHDHKAFIDDVVNTRNFLTHYDKALETKARSSQGLFGLVQRMKFMLEICLLTELGIPMEKIKDLISRNRRYQFLARNL